MEESFKAEGLQGVLHHPAQPDGSACALTHGAGTDHRAPLLVQVANALADAGTLVFRYDLPFRAEGRKGPPLPASQAHDREGVRRAIAMLRSRVRGRVIAGGHSYGGRQTAMAAAEDPKLADGLLLLSYPLHPPDHPEKARTSFFPEWRTPAVFIHGSRDPFGTLEEMRQALKIITVRVDLVPIEGAGHDLKRAGVAAAAVEHLRALVLS
jgi:predicted alpha/beta-hydrolase family hydrolase